VVELDAVRRGGPAHEDVRPTQVLGFTGPNVRLSKRCGRRLSPIRKMPSRTTMLRVRKPTRESCMNRCSSPLRASRPRITECAWVSPFMVKVTVRSMLRSGECPSIFMKPRSAEMVEPGRAMKRPTT
jgi:hypothetical protein